MPESDTHSKTIFSRGGGQRGSVARFLRYYKLRLFSRNNRLKTALRKLPLYSGAIVGLITVSLLLYEVLWALVDLDVRRDFFEYGISIEELWFDFCLCSTFCLLSLSYSYLLAKILKRFVGNVAIRWSLFSLSILIANIATAALSTSLLDYWFEYVSNDEIRAENFFVFGFVITFTTSSFVFITLGRATIESEQKRREAELCTVKAQLEPHFLMNTIGQLSEMAIANPAATAASLHQLSDLYRYIIDASSNNMTTVDEELMFLHDHVALMQLRFGKSVEVEVGSEVYGTYGWLLPMSLQLLVENAFKHNRKSLEHPVVVRIALDGDYIVVANDLQPLTMPLSTTHKGLENIGCRLSALTDRKLLVKETATQFIVRLPIIKPKLTDESIDH